MNSIARRLGTLLVAVALPAAVAAQNVVRCGNAYGEQPCPGGRVVPADDPRTQAQRAQAAAVIARDARMAQALEAARLRAESQAQPAPGSARKPGARSAQQQEPRTAKQRKPEHFTAVAPGTRKDAHGKREGSGKTSGSGKQGGQGPAAKSNGTSALPKR